MRSLNLSDFHPVDLSALGLDGIHCAKRYKVDKITEVAKQIYKADFGPDNIGLLTCPIARPVMALAIGTHKTELNKAKKDGHPVSDDELIQVFREQKLSSKEVFCIIIDYLANVERSAAANHKMLAQANRIREMISTLSEDRLRKTKIQEVMMDEFNGDLKKHRPDGILRISPPVLWYLRYGSGAGGSQGDRRSTFMSLPREFPDYKFVFIWDGTEVIDSVIDQVNAEFSGRVYITRTRNFDETRYRELCDLELTAQA